MTVLPRRRPRAMLRSAVPFRGAPAAVCREGRGVGGTPNCTASARRLAMLLARSPCPPGGFDRGAPDCHQHRLRELPGAWRQPRLAFQKLHRLAQLGVLPVHRADVNPHRRKRPIITHPAEHVVIYAPYSPSLFSSPLAAAARSPSACGSEPCSAVRHPLITDARNCLPGHAIFAESYRASSVQNQEASGT